MKNLIRTCEAAIKRSKRLPKGTLEHRTLDFVRERRRDPSLKDLANRTAFLSRGGAQPSKAEFERLLGTNDLVDEFYLERALLAASPVCRVSIRAASGHERGCATGFMVSPRLLLTNEHVFGSADEAAPSIAEFNYRFDVAGRPEQSYRFRLRPDLFFFNHEKLDFALVSVEATSEDGIALSTFGYHRLISQTGKALLKEWMTVIQHPGGARRQFAIRENQCVDDEDPDVVWYKSDTAQGSSGSPVLNDSFQVVALHHAGVPRQDAQKNYILKNGKKVKDITAVDDSEVDWIANAGIRISRLAETVMAEAREQGGHLAELNTAMQGGDVLSNAYHNESSPTGENMNSRINPNPTNNAGRIVLGTLVLELNSGVIAGQAPSVAVPIVPAPIPPSDGGGEMETLKEPIVDTNYKSRKGFVTSFLGVETPLPQVTNQSLIAQMINGQKIIPYEHFSVVLHKTRKLAIFTAANVDSSTKAKMPDPSKSYSRKSLTGLGDHDFEKWVLDPRVDAAFQIPDNFYTKDNGAFDKGHICRRDDVCFGKTFAQVQRANGDTYHVTNCSPQRGNFNQSTKSGIWGRLENFIGAQADKEQYCIFAGPILSPKDQTFVGTERVQLPSEFWKVVCAVKDQKLQVFAFILKQDTKDLPLEFAVNAEWKSKQVKLKDLEKRLGILKFQQKYHTADQG
ncbi:MAG TPA: DNA/RNA non-specific endonuclease [Pyrinomonadaceae bacterium]|jgi:endonuclease G|nr:DNA/RNA non-specific endonuclease [Pyrinomonadaceae bacterium]